MCATAGFLCERMHLYEKDSLRAVRTSGHQKLVEIRCIEALLDALKEPEEVYVVWTCFWAFDPRSLSMVYSVICVVRTSCAFLNSVRGLIDRFHEHFST